MYFVGQESQIRELDYIANDIANGISHNIMIRAPSGYGKTTLGLKFMAFLGFENCSYHIPNDEEIFFPPIEIDGKKLIILDEIHVVKTLEFLYPMMDSKQTSFLLLTNESGGLKEPIKNRCIQIQLSRYSEEDYLEIIKNVLKEYNLGDLILNIINTYAPKTSPRSVKIFCLRLEIIFRNYYIPETEEDITRILETILNLERGGFNEYDMVYLNYLGKIKTCSLNTIVFGTGIDKETIINEIEPKLLNAGKIIINSKGRTYVSKNNAME